MATDYSNGHTIEHVYVEGIGWGVFNTGDADEIERVDEFFPIEFDDTHAEWLVHFLAADGDKRAQRALRTITYSQINDACRWADMIGD